MAKKKSSSKAWLKEHRDDPYVQQAQREGYRSRACYKLLEIQEKDRIFRPGMTVLDLGSAPGGWSQVAAELVGHRGRVIASDILPMDSLAGVEFIEGDFTEDGVFEQILGALDGQTVDLVVSDIAPNLSGVNAVDQPRSMYLVELALDMARRVLTPGGSFVAKAFQGEGFDALFRDTQGSFSRVLTRKPKASRPRSKEVYVVGKGYRVGGIPRVSRGLKNGVIAPIVVNYGDVSPVDRSSNESQGQSLVPATPVKGVKTDYS